MLLSRQDGGSIRAAALVCVVCVAVQVFALARDRWWSFYRQSSVPTNTKGQKQNQHGQQSEKRKKNEKKKSPKKRKDKKKPKLSLFPPKKKTKATKAKA